MPTLATHGDGIRHADGVILPRQHLLLLDRLLDNLAKFENYSCRGLGQHPPSLSPVILFGRGHRGGYSGEYNSELTMSAAHSVSESCQKAGDGTKLTCKDFPPTRRSRCPRAAHSSSCLHLARQLRTTWPIFHSPSAHIVSIVVHLEMT